MVVMQILPDLNVGGAQTSVVALCRALLDRGAQVILVGLGRQDELSGVIPSSSKLTVVLIGLERHSVLFLPRFVWSVCRIVRRLAAIMRRHRVDVVQGHMANASLLGALAALFAGVPKRFATFHSIIFLPRKSRMDMRNRLMLSTLRWVAPWFTRYIAVSGAVRAALVDHGVDPSRVAVVPNGVALQDFERLQESHADRMRNELGLRDSDWPVVCVGTLREAKGHKYLIEAASELSAEFPDLVYLFVGDGAFRSSLEVMVAKLGLNDTVRFLGTRRDIARILSVGRVFVLPSLWEGLPVALLEAMAVGLPCVATRVAGSVEVLQSEDTGILVDPRDARQLADAIRTLRLDPGRAKAIGKNGQSLVRATYNLEGMASRLLELYRS